MELRVNPADIAVWLGAGYVLGSIPFGLLLTRLAGLGDIRSIGSGNIGATNVLRTGNKGLALATLLLDGGKGAAAVLLARLFAGDGGPEPEILAGAGAFLGHLFPVWLRFKGGKGVATFIGVLSAWSWPLGLAFCLCWLAMAVLFRISSLAALTAAALSPLAAWALERLGLAAAVTPMALMILFKHEANIIRLLKGQEPKIGQR